MQTNALSRQVALLAEPKNPLDSTMSTSSGFFVHTMKHCYATAIYTTEAQALSITHARISLPHACNHERSIYTEGIKCKTLGGILKCRLTNALSRQLALLAEPKNPLDSTMSTSSGFFVHTMKHC